jgi:hypothetical protein
VGTLVPAQEPGTMLMSSMAMSPSLVRPETASITTWRKILFSLLLFHIHFRGKQGESLADLNFNLVPIITNSFLIHQGVK